jgi:hypothetical protein
MPFRPAGLIGLSLVALMLSAPAWAQGADPGPISTAAGTAPPPAAVDAAEPLPLDTGPDNAGPVRDGKVHGMAEVGVGTGGYRHAAVAMDAPLQGGGEIAIAVDDTQYGAPSGRRRERAEPSN